MLASEVSVGHSRSQPTFPVSSLSPSIPRSNALAADSSSWPLRVSDLAEVGKCDLGQGVSLFSGLQMQTKCKLNERLPSTRVLLASLDASSISLAHQFTLPPSIPSWKPSRELGNGKCLQSQPTSLFVLSFCFDTRWEVGAKVRWFLIDVVYMIGLLMMAGLLVSSANGRWASG